MAIRYNFANRYRWRESRAPSDTPGTLVLRVDDVHTSSDRDGRREITGFWGTSMCSGEQIYVRLTTEEEELAENNRAVPPSRRSAARLVDEYPELARACLVPEERRPLVRCDRARLITDQEGRPTASVRFAQGSETMVYTRMRCGWMVPYVSYQSRLDGTVYPQEHMEAHRYSTVSMALARGRGGVDYQRVFAESLARAARLGMASYARAASDAAWDLVQAWVRDRLAGNEQARIGALSFTVWYPEKSFVFDLGDASGLGRQALTDFLAGPAFAPAVQCGSLGATAGPCAVQPECVLRFLNPEGEVCGVYRVTAYEFASLPAWARRAGAGLADTAEDRARLVLREMVQGLDPAFVAAHNIERVDILPGRNYRGDMHLVFPQVQQARALTSQGALCQLKNMVYLGLLHSQSPLGERRQNIGCAQAFMPRSAGDYVLGWFGLRDGSSYKNACLLAKDGASLKTSLAYTEELESEQTCLANIGLCPGLCPETRPETRQETHEKTRAEMSQDARPDARVEAGSASATWPDGRKASRTGVETGTLEAGCTLSCAQGNESAFSPRP